MAYTIVDSCTKDELCVEACPVDCIHPKKDEEAFEAAPQLYVDPNGCIDCGACVPVCPTNSVFPNEEVPADKAEFIAGMLLEEGIPCLLRSSIAGYSPVIDPRDVLVPESAAEAAREALKWERPAG